MRLSDISKETIYLTEFLRHMKFKNFIDECTVIYCDDQSALHINKNAVNILGASTYTEEKFC